MNDTTHRETIPTDDEVLTALPRSIAAGAFEVFDPEKAARELTAESETESWTEQKMRADFMHAQSFVSRDPEDYDPADALDYAEYANPWISGDEKWMNEWIYLQSATQRWREDPEFAAGLNIEGGGDDAPTPIQLRSELQARYIAEHGIERAENGLLTSHYVTRIEDRDHGPSPLANYLPGNALAAHAANFERDGVER
ncbi:hypothetical protein KO481_33485 [Nocardia sp. NEAU-G5]|uniref:Uncharacterized protein n=1 Tax=Nocardia albiluteola TaxID=2842303 RepID=A0ABS6B7Y5_9NOCA|nr:hypothetical protein [Nocardia albiluteola]MBU3066422.1 hypothetical protein [Nocardia albiluteola]